MDQCPYGLKVGALPAIEECPDGVQQCTCLRQMIGYAFGIVGPHTMEVVEFWQAHPNGGQPFEGREWPDEEER